jgi:hypothetical protein
MIGLGLHQLGLKSRWGKDCHKKSCDSIGEPHSSEEKELLLMAMLCGEREVPLEN